VVHGILPFLELDKSGRQHLDDGVRILKMATVTEKQFQIQKD
jgi:hypothetical protein